MEWRCDIEWDEGWWKGWLSRGGVETVSWRDNGNAGVKIERRWGIGRKMKERDVKNFKRQTQSGGREVREIKGEM